MSDPRPDAAPAGGGGVTISDNVVAKVAFKAISGMPASVVMFVYGSIAAMPLALTVSAFLPAALVFHLILTADLYTMKLRLPTRGGANAPWPSSVHSVAAHEWTK